MNAEKEIRIVWDRAEPEPVANPSPLSRPVIVACGIRLADAAGLEGVSFRKVAVELNAGPMRLYRFVASKEELLELMVDEVYAEIDAARGGEEMWRESLRNTGLAYRAASFRHPWFVDLLGGRPHVGPHALAVLEATAAAIAMAPRSFTPSETWSALGAVNAYLFGAIRSDVIDPRPGNANAAGPMTGAIASYLTRTLQSHKFATLQRLATEAERPNLEEDFLWGLDVVLKGLE